LWWRPPQGGCSGARGGQGRRSRPSELVNSYSTDRVSTRGCTRLRNYTRRGEAQVCLSDNHLPSHSPATWHLPLSYSFFGSPNDGRPKRGPPDARLPMLHLVAHVVLSQSIYANTSKTCADYGCPGYTPENECQVCTSPHLLSHAPCAAWRLTLHAILCCSLSVGSAIHRATSIRRGWLPGLNPR
jgi:hypothetical protein